MTDMTPPQTLPLALGDIFQLVAEARNSPPTEAYEHGELSELIDFVSAACLQAESAAEYTAGFGGDESPQELSDFLCAQLADIWDQLHIPAGLEWTSVGSTLAAISPWLLRSGRRNLPRAIPENGDVLVRIVAWRYLASRLAMCRAARPKAARHRSSWYDAQRSLVFAAKKQRTLHGLMLVRRSDAVRELTTLAVTACESDHPASYLISMTELARQGAVFPELVSRAKDALSKVNSESINHNIVMTDSIASDINIEGAYYMPDSNIHLIGNPNKVRFIIFVSDVPDQSEERDLQDNYGGRFRLDKIRLRDVLVGGDQGNAGPGGRALNLDTGLVSIREKPPDEAPSFFRSLSKRLTAGAEEINDAESETLISRSRAARAFFGYKGLLDPDHH